MNEPLGTSLKDTWHVPSDIIRLIMVIPMGRAGDFKFIDLVAKFAPPVLATLGPWESAGELVGTGGTLVCVRGRWEGGGRSGGGVLGC